MDFHYEPSNSWGLSGCAVAPLTLQHLGCHKGHSSTGLQAPGILQWGDSDFKCLKQIKSCKIHTEKITSIILIYIYIYICTYIHRISYILIFISVICGYIMTYHILSSDRPDRSRSAVEAPPASITKASWNPVSFSRTVSAVCRAKETRQGTVGNRGERVKYPLVMSTVCYWTWPFMVDFPMKNAGFP